jgi:hypothetical protein
MCGLFSAWSDLSLVARHGARKAFDFMAILWAEVIGLLTGEYIVDNHIQKLEDL